ncbi:MAG: hypothetical protein K8I30_18385, partial [Anaerolineae bacterium]|nr:hypothetical protein [Anaerolineae bacterium]
MAERTTTLPDALPQPRIDPQRMAWGVLLLSFAIFCSICIVTGLGLNYFLFQSTVLMETDVQVGRGSVSVNSSTVYSYLSLTSAAELRTDPQAQSTIFFRDSQKADRLIASITIRANTNVTLRRAVRPRFRWSSGSYMIELQDLTGDLDIFIPNDLERDVRLTIQTPQGALADFGSSGQYFVSASESQIRVINRQGQVSLVPANTNQGRAIPVNNLGVISSAGPEEVALLPAVVNLIQNSTFQDVVTTQDDGGTTSLGLATSWGCTNSTTNLPRGSYQAEMQDGRYLLHFLRGENAQTNGETRCGTFPGGGYDVRSYSTLVLRAMFKIQFQSLNACGSKGSECPLMLRVDYTDERGAGHSWYHGFYAKLDPQLNDPKSCDSCTSEHEQVNYNTWYTYDSGNWFTLFAPDMRPATILNV